MPIGAVLPLIVNAGACGPVVAVAGGDVGRRRDTLRVVVPESRQARP
jgi:hypothetical protein